MRKFTKHPKVPIKASKADKWYTCPECHNKTVVPVYPDNTPLVDEGEVFICNECGAEFEAHPQYNGQVVFTLPFNEYVQRHGPGGPDDLTDDDYDYWYSRWTGYVDSAKRRVNAASCGKRIREATHVDDKKIDRRLSSTSKRYKGYRISLDKDHECYNIYDPHGELEDHGFRSMKDAMAHVDGLVSIESSKDIHNNVRMKITKRPVACSSYPEGTYWMAKYKDMNGNLHKIVFQFDAQDFDEAEEEMDAVIPEPYTAGRLLGRCNPELAEKDGFVVLSSQNIHCAEEIEDYEDDIQEISQEFTSENTSINSGKLPAIFKLIHLAPGTINIDYGGGKFDNVAEYLAPMDVINLVYDPYNRTPEHNREVIRTVKKAGGADSATCSNVLNVIKEPEVRRNVLENIRRLVKPEGVVYITVYEGSGKGNEGPTKSGYQLNRKTADYLAEIQEVFPDAMRKGKLIIAHPNGSAVTSAEDLSYDALTCEDCIYDLWTLVQDDSGEWVRDDKIDTYDDYATARAEARALANDTPCQLVEVGPDGVYVAWTSRLPEKSLPSRYWEPYAEDADYYIQKQLGDGTLEAIYQYLDEHPGIDEKMMAEDIMHTFGVSKAAAELAAWQWIMKDEDDYVEGASGVSNKDLMFIAKKAAEVSTAEDLEEIISSLLSVDKKLYTKYSEEARSDKSPAAIGKDISDELYWRAQGDKVTAADYGGAYDIADDEYFSKDELMEFAYSLEPIIQHLSDDEDSGSIAEVSDVYLNGNKLGVAFMIDGAEHSGEVRIDKRRVKRVKDLYKYVTPLFEQIADSFWDYVRPEATDDQRSTWMDIWKNIHIPSYLSELTSSTKAKGQPVKAALVETPKDVVDSLIDILDQYGFILDPAYKTNPGKTWMGAVHLQVINETSHVPQNDFVALKDNVPRAMLDAIHELEESSNCPITWSFGVNKDGQVTAGLDIMEQYVEDAETIMSASSISMKAIHDKLLNAASKRMQKSDMGFPLSEIADYLIVEEEETEDGALKIEVRCELSYRGMEKLAEALDPIVARYDKNAYFDMVAPGIMEAFIFNKKVTADSMTPVKSSRFNFPELPLEPPDYDEPEEHSSIEYIIVDLDDDILVSKDTFEFQGTPEFESEEDDWVLDEYPNIQLDDAENVTEHVLDVIEPQIPAQPGVYRVRGRVKLAYDVLVYVSYESEGPDDGAYIANEDMTEIDFNYKKSSVEKLEVGKD